MKRELKKITQEQLNELLKQHELWLGTEGKEGKRADLSGMNLNELDFSDRDLRQIILRDCSMENASFDSAETCLLYTSDAADE